MRIRYSVRTIVILAGIVFIGALLVFFVTSPKSPFTGLQNDLKKSEPEIEHSYLDLDGNKIQFSDFKGKSLVVNSWATWMPFSKDELALLNEYQTTYGDQVTILAINRMEDREVIKSYLALYGIDQKIKFIADPTDYFYKSVGGFAMPETIFFRKDGTLHGHTRGVISRDVLEDSIKNILN